MIRFLFILVFLWAGGFITFYFARKAWRRAEERKDKNDGPGEGGSSG